MPTRNVVLTNHQTSFVEQLVSSGRYQNANEVLREWRSERTADWLTFMIEKTRINS